MASYSPFQAPRGIPKPEELPGIFQRVQQALDRISPRLLTIGLAQRDLTPACPSIQRVSPPSAGMRAALPAASAENGGQSVRFLIENPAGDLVVYAAPNQLVAGARTATFDTAGLIELVSNGVDAWLLQAQLPAESPGGSALDAEYVLGAAHTSLPNGRVATDSTEIDADLASPGAVSWALKTASVVFSKLQDLTGLSVLGRASNSAGVMAAITASGARQALISDSAGTAIGFRALEAADVPAHTWSEVLAAGNTTDGTGSNNPTISAGDALAFASGATGITAAGDLLVDGAGAVELQSAGDMHLHSSGALHVGHEGTTTTIHQGATGDIEIVTSAGYSCSTTDDVAFSSGGSHKISTGATLRLELDNTGAWNLAGDPGTAGEFLRTAGSGAPPVWDVLALTDLPAQAADTFLGNVGTISATPAAVSLSSLASTSIVFGSHTFQLAAGTGEVTWAQNSTATTIVRSTDFTWTGEHRFEAAVDLAHAIRLNARVSETLAADKDDVDMSASNLYRTVANGFTLHGMTPAFSGQIVLIDNADSTDPLYIDHDNCSTASHGFYTPNGATYRVPPRSFVWGYYDGINARWRLNDADTTGRLLRVTHYTTGTAASHSFLPGAVTAIVDVLSSGGGGASVANPAAGQAAVGGGGGSGVWVRALWTISTASITFTVGSGASGGSSGNASSVTDGTNTISCPGGPTGAALSSGTSQTFIGGGSSVSSPTLTGAGSGFKVLNGATSTMHPGDGGNGVRLSGTAAASGDGAASPLGGGTAHGRITTGTGITGKAPGAGGGGALSFNAGGAQTGGASLPGFVTIYEYS